MWTPLFCRPVTALRSKHALPSTVALTLGRYFSVRAHSLGAKITISPRGKEIKADWGPGRPPSTFHAAWLRRNCQCPLCVTTSGQRAIKSTDLDPCTTITRAQAKEGGDLEVTWSCGHKGSIGVEWLQRHCYSAHSLCAAMEKRRPSTATSMPEVHFKDLAEERGVWRWLSCLNEYGMCLLRSAPPVPGTLQPIVGKVSHIQRTIYGEVFDVISKESPINIAYTNAPIEPHMDLEYYESPPGLQFLFCLRNDACVVGGESVVVDGFAVLEKLRREYPQHFSTLARVPATFQKIHYERDNPVHMVYRRPHITLDRTGQVTKFSWSPPFEGPLQVAEEDVGPYCEAYHCLANMVNDPEFKVAHRLNPGDILGVNNHRVLHARSGFELNGGVRHFQGAFVNIDEFKSRFLVLCSKFAPDHIAKHVFNQDHASYA